MKYENILQISCDFKLSSLFKDLTGLRLVALHPQKGSFVIGKELTLSVIGELLLSAYNEQQKLYKTLQLISKGHESYVGNLYGIEVSSIEVPGRRFDLMEYNFSISSDFGIITKIIGLGEIRKENVSIAGREEEIQSFFPEGTILPEAISIDKRTLEVIAFQFDSKKFMYLFPDGEGYFRIEFDASIQPEHLANRWDFVAMEKNLQVLEIFE